MPALAFNPADFRPFGAALLVPSSRASWIDLYDVRAFYDWYGSVQETEAWDAMLADIEAGTPFVSTALPLAEILRLAREESLTRKTTTTTTA